jgi:PAS domain S-box-containing protein
MSDKSDKMTKEKLLAVNTELRIRLEEAEETLRAIREGEVDAVIVSGSKGDRVFSLAETENLHRLMVETMNEVGIATSPEGTVLFCNQRACDLLGVRQEQMLGRCLREFVVRQDAERIDGLLADARTKAVDDRILFVSTDGTLIPMHIWANLLDRSDGAMICLVGTDFSQLEADKDIISQLGEQQEALRRSHDELEMRVQERTAELAQTIEELQAEVERRNAAEKVLLEQAGQLRILASELTLAEQRERRRLARVLHDDLQQLLVAAKFQVVPLLREPSEAVQLAAREVGELISQSIETSRTLTGELSPPILHEGGLSAAMKWLKRWMMDKYGLSIELSCNGDLEDIGEDTLAIMFHSIKELLFNVVKHAGVRYVRADVQREGQHVRAVISDDGVGFDPSKMTGHGGVDGGFGLFSINERFAVMGGSLSVESVPGKGSRITLVSPPVKEKRQAVTADEHPSSSAVGTESEDMRGAKRSFARKLRLLLVDDHAIVRQGLRRLLEDEADMEIAGEASDGERAIAMVRELAPDVVLMDIGMPGMGGVVATRAIHAEFPEVIVIGLSMFEGPERAAEMCQAGAADYVAKSDASETLVRAIQNAGRSLMAK